MSRAVRLSVRLTYLSIRGRWFNISPAMTVHVPELSGFCPGVKHAERNIFKEKGEKGRTPIYVYGYMINNRNYIRYLENHEIFTVDDPDELPEGSVVVIRTHGINRHQEQKLRAKHEVIDLTCGNVKKVQLKILEQAESGALVVITGKKAHPEVLGLISYAREARVVESEEDLGGLIAWCRERRGEIEGRFTKIFITSQTTGNRTLFLKTVLEAKRACGSRLPVEEFDSICPITTNKEKEALEIQKKVDITVVIGDPLSSNANKLYSILLSANPSTYFVQDLDHLIELGLPLHSFSTAQVVSSASTPEFVEGEIISYLQKDR